MNPIPLGSSGSWPVGRIGVFAFVTMIGMMLWLVPKYVVVRGDDFGYLESLLSTLQSGTWTSSDWLGPFNVPLPFLSAAVYSLGKNFWMASVGVIAATSVLNFFLLNRWLCFCDWPKDRCHLTALAISLSPVWLNKSLEYTCVPLGLALVLSALMLWQAKKTELFFIVLWLAIANRQSAVCLLAFPLVSMAREWKTNHRFSLHLFPWLLLSMALVGYLLFALPSTYAREVWSLQRPVSVETFLGDVLLGLFICAGSGALWLVMRAEDMVMIWKENLKRPILSLLMTGAGAWLVFTGASFLNCETPGLARFSPVILVAAVVAGAWFYPWHRPWSWEMAGFVFAYVLLVSWRGQWWDYYLLEPVLVVSMVSRSVVGAKSGGLPGFAMALIALGLLYGGYLSVVLRSYEARVIAYETEIRRGSLRITDLSDAPFGYLGWKLFRVARGRHDPNAKLSDFLRYVELSRLVLTDGQYAVWHRIDHQSIHPSGEKWDLPLDYRDRRFPLGNDEWREEISRGSR